MMYSSAALEDGVLYLRAGALDRAWQAFTAVAQRSRDPAIRSEALRRQADVKRRRADWGDALGLLAEAVQIAQDHALRDHLAAARNIEGSIHLQRGDFDAAVAVYTAALRDDPGPRQRGLICQNLGTAHAQRGACGEAAAWYQRSAAAFAAAGCRREQVLVMNNRGSICLDQGDFAAAEAIFREALREAMTLPQADAELQGLAELNLAESLARQGVRLEEAYDLLLRATGHFTASQDRPSRVACHRVFAVVTEAQGYPELARGALERGLELAQEIGSAPEIAAFERELARLGAACPHLN